MHRTSRTGSQTLTLRAWPFGAPSRRRLLEVVLCGGTPKEGWSRRGLERACDVGNGTLDDQLAAAVHLGLLTFENARFFVVKPLPPLGRSLRAVLRDTATTPDQPPTPLPRRRYTQRS